MKWNGKVALETKASEWIWNTKKKSQVHCFKAIEYKLNAIRQVYVWNCKVHKINLWTMEIETFKRAFDYHNEMKKCIYFNVNQTAVHKFDFEDVRTRLLVCSTSKWTNQLVTRWVSTDRRQATLQCTALGQECESSTGGSMPELACQ